MPQKVELRWGDGKYDFCLPIKELRELQEKTTCGPAELLRRLGAGEWRLDDVRETLRLGLVGGGKKPTEASLLVERYVDGRPLAESVPPAQAVLMVLLFGDLADDLKEDEKPPGEPQGRRSESGQTEGSPSPTSTAPAQ